MFFSIFVCFDDVLFLSPQRLGGEVTALCHTLRTPEDIFEIIINDHSGVLKSGGVYAGQEVGSNNIDLTAKHVPVGLMGCSHRLHKSKEPVNFAIHWIKAIAASVKHK
ncbi:hypothetical protein MUK70_13370 [Dyadobacter chenwenxiniae]|uniref:hypothetical protein n=1 Tax=Dyadobacter chenwenxiniae TaxID=2906456 RepID=UPI001F301856|nr:hypothetical protein [Dyadobacter chenwenxiniae]UON85969.1 hypothetical protein MUK70_13370 [Dyadobacter chenwenxiniae]